MPHWLCATALLGACGSAACLPALDSLASHPVHCINTLTTLAMTLQRLAARLDRDDHQSQVRNILERMTRTELVGTFDYAQRPVGQVAQLAITGQYSEPSSRPAAPVLGQSLHGNTAQDNTWQLHLAIAKARLAWGLDIHAQAAAYLQDPRSLVRRAMTQVIAGADVEKQGDTLGAIPAQTLSAS